MRPNEIAKGRSGGWRWHCVMAIVVPILISSCASGKNETPGNTAQGSRSSGDHEIAAYDMVVSRGPNDHEIEARDKKINLNSHEMEGLQHSLDQLKGSGSAASHVDVDVQGDSLTFKADNDSAHLASATRQIQVGPAMTPVRAAISPAALDNLKKR
jgi:hypothetical protein